jgi:hypothetical protein
MVITRIRYTVNPEYSAYNKENISRVMAELRALDRQDVQYSVFVEDDGTTFVHLVMCADEEAKSVIPGLESFKTFRTELKAGSPDVQPVTTHLTLVGSSHDLVRMPRNAVKSAAESR